MITEAWMGTGSWSLRLKPETPGSVIDALDWTKTTGAGFGHVFVFPSRTDARLLSSANLLANSKYTGVLLEWGDALTISGAGPGWWMGDSDEQGPLIETAITNTSGSLGTWLASLTPSSLNTGGTAGSGTTVTATFQWVTYRRALEAICAQNAASALPGCGWWVTPDMKLNVGGPTDVYNGTPPLALRRFAGRDTSIQGLSNARVDRSMDITGYVSKVRANGPAGVGTYSAASGYKDINGNTASRVAIIDVPTSPAGAESTAAQAEYNARNATRRHVRIATDTFDLVGHEASQVRTGAYINVFDPETGLYDQTNQVYFQGQPLWPIKLQVLAQTYPIREGYGVWFRDGNGNLTDLTEWFVPETGDASIDAGAIPRTFGNPAGISGLVELGQVGPAVDNGAWTTWTPALTASSVNPTLGSGSTTTGRYKRFGSTIIGHGQITFGTAGVAAGTGTYRVSLPFTPATTGANADIAGTAWMLDASTNDLRTAILRTFPGGAVAEVYFTATTNFFAAAGSPWTWAASDTIRYSFSYEAAIT